MEKILIKYNKYFQDLYKCKKEDDLGSYHMIRDIIYEEFIIDISLNKFSSIKEIKYLAKLIKKNELVHDNKLWYA
jgi:hypothetical protein